MQEHTHYWKSPPGWPVFCRSAAFLTISFISLAILSACAYKQPSLASGLKIQGVEQETTTQKAGCVLTERFEAQGAAQRTPSHDILVTAYSQMGKPYRLNGAAPETGFDTIGYAAWVYGQHGITLPRSAPEIANAGTPVKPANIRPGDLLVYRQSRGGPPAYVGIYTGAGKILTPVPGSAVKETTAFDRIRVQRFLTARRILDDPKAGPLNLSEKEAVIKQALAANVPSAQAKDFVETSRVGRLPESNAEETNEDQSAKLDAAVAAVQNRQDKNNAAQPGAAAMTTRAKTGNPLTAVLNRKAAPKPVTQTATVQGPIKTASKAQVRNYQVKPGDTIWQVAAKFGVSPNHLRQANNLASPNLRVGQTIAIP